MTRLCLGGLLALTLLAVPALAQPTIDGEVDAIYCTPLVVQDTQTEFGDANMGQHDFANGSELDNAYAYIEDGMLYLMLCGNLETNWNKMEIFFDTRAGGQNKLRGDNPNVDYDGLNRMGDDGSDNGLIFDTGFEADFYITFGMGNDPVELHANYAELYVDAGNPGVGYYLGMGGTRCDTNDGDLTGGDAGAPVVKVTFDNVNTAGVAGGTGLISSPPEYPEDVITGAELVIDLADIGSPTTDFRICAFINAGDHGWVSNQILGPIFGGGNFGEPRSVDFSTVTNNQYFTVPIVTPPCGSCCVGTVCTQTTEAACAGTWTENESCDGNPCDATAQGACCRFGVCTIETEADCIADGVGIYMGDDTTCDDCACMAVGACCLPDTSCTYATQDECENTLNGVFAGPYTDCDDDPCEGGACCVDFECSVMLQHACTGVFWGVGTDCTTDPDICNPYITGEMDGWNSAAHRMTETGTGTNIYTYTYSTLTADTRYEFKVTDSTWGWSHPGPNSWFYTDGTGGVTVEFDMNVISDGWDPTQYRFGLDTDPAAGWTAVGDWQSEIGSGADWTNNDPLTVMLDPEFDNIYTYQGTGLPQGTYVWKAVVTGSWDGIGFDARSVNAGNQEFYIPGPTDTVTMEVDALTGAIRLTAPCDNSPIGDANCDGSTNNFDIDAFVLAVSSGQAAWEAQYTCHFFCACDVNRDGSVNNFDIDPFVALLTGK